MAPEILWECETIHTRGADWEFLTENVSAELVLVGHKIWSGVNRDWEKASTAVVG